MSSSVFQDLQESGLKQQTAWAISSAVSMKGYATKADLLAAVASVEERTKAIEKHTQAIEKKQEQDQARNEKKQEQDQERNEKTLDSIKRLYDRAMEMYNSCMHTMERSRRESSETLLKGHSLPQGGDQRGHSRPQGGDQQAYSRLQGGSQ